MSDYINIHQNIGAYGSPFSGVGIEFDPIWMKIPDRSIVLHECGHLASNRDWNFAGVFSPFWRLYFNSDPGHHILFDSGAVELDPSRLALIPPHHRFHCRGEDDASHLWIHFSFSKLPENADRTVVEVLPNETLLCLIRDLKALLANQGDLGKDQVHQTATALVFAALAASGIRWKPPLPAILERLRQHIQSHLLEDLSNPTLAKIAGFSVPSLSRIFNNFLGRGPAQYVTEIRVRESARLLLESHLSIDEIAEQTGFPNRFYFSRVFKSTTGTSPAFFRSKYRPAPKQTRSSSRKRHCLG